MAHGRHVACKTKVEAKKEASSTSSEDGAERAICRQGLAGAGRLAIRIDGGFSVSLREESAQMTCRVANW